MKKRVFAYIMTAVVAAFCAGFVVAQATVDLYPSVQVSTEVRANAVWAVCYTTGYSGSWSDASAMWTHYRQQLNQHLRDTFRQAKRDEAAATQDDATLGLE